MKSVAEPEVQPRFESVRQLRLRILPEVGASVAVPGLHENKRKQILRYGNIRIYTFRLYNNSP